jgi:hypothetical protein
MAKALQHSQTAFIARISATCTTDVRTYSTPPRWDHANAVTSMLLVQKGDQANYLLAELRPLRSGRVTIDDAALSEGLNRLRSYIEQLRAPR